MIENVLSHMDGVGIYGVISICIFFAVFIIVTIWMFRLKQPYLRSMSELPLDDATVPTGKSQPAKPNQSHE